MKDFKEIAEKCLNGELSGTFVCSLNGKTIIKVPSNNLFRYKETCYQINYSYPYTYDIYDKFGVTKFKHNRVINFIPDMTKNDKRNVQISLSQAREWYKSGDDTLKTLALSAFSKGELEDSYPRSFNEYFKKHSNGSNILKMYPTKELQEKFNAYIKLISLRYDWIHIWSQEQGLEDDWEPEWVKKNNYCINYNAISSTLIELTVDSYSYKFHSLSFPTRELAEDFMNTFKDLLEKAKGLY